MRTSASLLLLLSARHTIAAAGERPSDTLTVRGFDAERIAALRSDPAHQYEHDIVREPTWWELLKEWLADWFSGLFGSRVGSFVTEYLFHIITSATILFALYILSKGGLRNFLYGAPRSLGEVTPVEEDIRDMDLPAMIAEAEAQGDLRRAIRLHYLLVLRKLVDRGLLEWSPDRTDRDYLAQLSDPDMRQRFAQAARVFQWTWYGRAPLAPERYAELRRPFIQFEQQPA
jgi:hypothetical protein